MFFHCFSIFITALVFNLKERKEKKLFFYIFICKVSQNNKSLAQSEISLLSSNSIKIINQGIHDSHDLFVRNQFDLHRGSVGENRMAIFIFE